MSALMFDAQFIVFEFFCCILLFALLGLRHLINSRTACKRAPRKVVKPVELTCYRSHRKPAWVLKEVLRLKALMGKDAGCRSIALTFNRIHASSGESVRKSFVSDAVPIHQYEIMHLRRELRAKLPASVAVNDVWAMDITFLREPSSVSYPVLGIIDHGSRMCTRLSVIKNKRSWTILGHLCLAIGQYGLPRAVRTDNEHIFRSHVFSLFLRVLGIHKQTIPTCAPWCNGRIERLFGTMKPWLAQMQFVGSAALQTALLNSQWFYNEVRPHQNLDGLTSSEWFAGLRSSDLRYRKGQTQVVSTLAGVLCGVWIRACQTNKRE